MLKERKRASRTAVEIPAIVFVGSDRLQCRLLNVSATGIALASSSRRPRGAWVRIHFQLPGQLEITEADAVLVRSDERGPEAEWGVEFLNLRPEARAQLHEFVDCVPTIHPGPEAAEPEVGTPSEMISEQAAAQEQERLHKLRLRALYRKALDQLD